MMNRSFVLRSAALALLVIFAYGCSQNQESVSKKSETEPPHETAAQQALPEKGPAIPEGLDGAPGLVWQVPESFHKEPPANRMRVAQYSLSASAEGAKPGEVAVFFFGAGQGGGTQANLERWAGQFTQDDGADPMSRAKIGHSKTESGLAITTIELKGHYISSGMGSGPSYDEPGWELYGAVVEGTGGPWFFKAVGPEAVIETHRQAIGELLHSARTHS